VCILSVIYNSLLVPLALLITLTVLTRSALHPTTSLMPVTSSIAHWPMSAPTATIGLVPPALLTARTSFGSIAPMLIQPVTSTVATASPYAASLLPK